jgi:oxygen-dependent protoporphyrinogen oxidase
MAYLSQMIAIIGGGISGLALSRYLGESGVEHVVLEACEAPGGVMRTDFVEGIPLDRGPQRMRLTSAAAELVDALGLSGQLLYARPDLPLWAYRQGKLRRVPLTPAQALSTDLIGWTGKLRMLAEPLSGGPRSDESVESFLVRKFGREAYDAFLGPLYGGLYASDPARMKARHGLQQTLTDFGVKGSLLIAAIARGFRAREAVPTVSFEGGLGAFPNALARAAGSSLRLATGVESITRSGGGWSLRLGGRGSGEILDARRVVLALPAPAAARVLEQVDAEAARRIGSLRYNRLAVVHLQSTCDLEGFGYQVAFGETLETRGVTWNASMFARAGVYTAYLGGMKNLALVDRPDDWIGEVAQREFQTVTGCASRVLMVSRTSVPAWDESWDALAGLVLPVGVETCASWAARPGIPGRLAQAKSVAQRLIRG